MARHREAGREGLLCVANFPANTGFAWNFIEALYAGVADRLAGRGIATRVAYPFMAAPPGTLRASAAQPVELTVRLRAGRELRVLLDFIRRHDVRVVYLCDRAAWHPGYLALRAAGVRRIIVHDHTSGERTAPRGPKRLAKRLSRRLPGMLADDVVAVSDYVARRKIEVDLVPAERVTRIWNSLPIPPRDPTAAGRVRDCFGIARDRPVIACACRAAPEKGVPHLLRAFDRIAGGEPAAGPPPALIYMGDGPILGELRALREALRSKDDVVFAGYRPDAAELLGGADICIAPSVWQEAFGLSALEPMARGTAVVASRVGGIPEVIRDGETGLLVPPADEAALERAIRRLLADPAERKRLGENGRRRAERYFAREEQLRRLVALVERGFARGRGR